MESKWTPYFFMNNIINELKQVNPKYRIYIAKKYEQEIRSYFNDSEYSLSLLIKCLCDGTELPISYCNSEPKYEKAKLYKVCNKFKLKDKTSCTVCYDNYIQDSLKTRINTNIEKYNTDNPMKVQYVKEKLKATNNKKYGVDYSLSSESIQTKIQNKRNKQKVYKRYNIISTSIYGKYILKNEISTGDYLSYHNFQCLTCGNDFKFKLSNNYSSIRCTYCEPLIRTYETKISDFLISLGLDIIKNDRKILDGKEIDIFIPKYNVGIEFNGLYWHSTVHKDKNYHQNKSLLAKSKGIRLIQLFEDEYKSNEKLIHKRLAALFSTERIAARKCVVKLIDSKKSKQFVDKYHIQKSTTTSTVHIGLYYNDELVSVMTFGFSRFNKSYQYELHRFCSSMNIQGGAGKLLKFFETNYKPSSILTYSDLNWGYGDVYSKIGFEYIDITKPSYFYYSSTEKTRISRYQAQKKKLIKKYNFSEELTESEMTEKLKWLKIYTSGNLIFEKIYK